MTKKKWKSIRLFLYVAPFIALVIIFSYYPLYGWIYAFYDYRPPKPFSEAQFVGLKWFKSLVENDVKIKQIVQVLKNTFAMSALTLGTSWLPMLFAVFLNEIRCVKFRKFVQTVTTLPNFVSWVLVYSVAFSLFNSTGKYTVNEAWIYNRANFVFTVYKACLVYSVAVADLEESWLGGNYVHSSNFWY